MKKGTNSKRPAKTSIYKQPKHPTSDWSKLSPQHKLSKLHLISSPQIKLTRELRADIQFYSRAAVSERQAENSGFLDTGIRTKFIALYEYVNGTLTYITNKFFPGDIEFSRCRKNAIDVILSTTRSSELEAARCLRNSYAHMKGSPELDPSKVNPEELLGLISALEEIHGILADYIRDQIEKSIDAER